MPRDVEMLWVSAGGGEAKAEPVIFPREAINFCMSPLGARGLARDVELARLLVDRLLERPRDKPGEGVKVGTGEDGLRGDGLRFGVEEGVLKLLGRGGGGRVRGLSFWF